jgi:hypothetical protein
MQQTFSTNTPRLSVPVRTLPVSINTHFAFPCPFALFLPPPPPSPHPAVNPFVPFAYLVPPLTTLPLPALATPKTKINGKRCAHN